MHEVTLILSAIEQGDQNAAAQLLPLFVRSGSSWVSVRNFSTSRSSGSGWNILANEPTPGIVYVTMFNSIPSAPGAGTIANLRFHTELTASIGTHPVGVDIATPGQGGLMWTHDDGSVTIDTNPAYQPGDFDGDSDVDGADFVTWQTHFPMASGATGADGDADCDGDVDGADFVIWQTNFPTSPGPGVASGGAASGPLGGENLLGDGGGEKAPGASSSAAAGSAKSTGGSTNTAPAVIVTPMIAAPSGNGSVAAMPEFSPLVSVAAAPIVFSAMPSAPSSDLGAVSSPVARLSSAFAASNPIVEIDDLGPLGSLAFVNPFAGLGLADAATRPSIAEGYRHSAGALGLNRFSAVNAIDELYADSLLDPTDELCHELADAVYEDGQADADADEYAELFEALEV